MRFRKSLPQSAKVYTGLLWGLSLLIVGGFLISLVLPAVCPPNCHRDPLQPESDEHHNMLKHVAMAIIIYEQDQGEFPPVVCYAIQGKVSYSWRVALLPYLEKADAKKFAGATELYKEYDFTEPWNGPHNRELAARATNYYALSGLEDRGNCLAVVAEDGKFNQDRQAFCLSGLSFPYSVILIQHLDTGIHWMEPKDMTVAELQEKLKQIPPDSSDSIRGLFGTSDACAYSLYDLEICTPLAK